MPGAAPKPAARRPAGPATSAPSLEHQLPQCNPACNSLPTPFCVSVTVITVKNLLDAKSLAIHSTCSSPKGMFSLVVFSVKTVVSDNR